MRRRAKVDDNHGEIVEALRALQWGVKSTAALGHGFPDLVAVKNSRVVFIEVKDGAKSPSRRKRTSDEVDAHAWFQRYGVEVLLIEKVSDLAVLDRDARAAHEGVTPRDFYREKA